MREDPDDDYPIGLLLPGTKYVVVRKLGQGGMGVVYEVVKEPGIRGAAKIMSAKLAKRTDAVKRFYDEAARVAKLRHPNIVQVIDYDKLGDGTPFFVMELLEGKTLGQLLRDMRGRGLRPEHAFAIQTQLLAGLHHAHTLRGADGVKSPIIHRDIKPDNIFLYLPSTDHAEPSVKVLDLGISAAGDGTTEKQFIGSYPWAAPEQFKLEPATPQTDLYAAGLVLYKMLTGKNPFEDLNSHEEFSLAHVAGEVPPLPEWVPAEVRALVMSSLAKDPELRPKSAYEFSAKLWSLQFVRRGAERTHDVNTTAPTLGTLAELASDAMDQRDGKSSTLVGMSAPPVEGDTLEVVSQAFSPETLARGVARPLGAAGTVPEVDLSRHDTPPSIRLELARRAALASADTHTQPGLAERLRAASERSVAPRPGTSTAGIAQSIVGGARRARLAIGVLGSVAALGLAMLAAVAVRTRHAASVNERAQETVSVETVSAAHVERSEGADVVGVDASAAEAERQREDAAAPAIAAVATSPLHAEKVGAERAAAAKAKKGPVKVVHGGVVFELEPWTPLDAGARPSDVPTLEKWEN